jgi:hypothetical protein
MIFASFFILYSAVSQKMDHFDISFACSIFSKSWDVPNHGFLGVAHLPVSLVELKPVGVSLVVGGVGGTVTSSMACVFECLER